MNLFPAQQIPRLASALGGAPSVLAASSLVDGVGKESSLFRAWCIGPLAVVSAVLVQCSPAAPPPAPPPPVASVTTTPPATTTPSATTTRPPPPLQPVTAADLGPSWHPGCPIEPRRAAPGRGRPTSASTARPTAATLIVNEDLATEVVAIFEQLLQLRYPIKTIRTLDAYPNADDELSMEDNNTSAFNCRDIPGTGRWSPTRIRSSHRPQPAAESRDRSGRRHSTQDRRAIPRPHPHRPRHPARGRPCRSPLHRSWLALGR